MTPPVVGPETPFVFAIVGDLGQTDNSTSTRDHIMSNPVYQQLIIIGDLSYADSAWNPKKEGKNCTQLRWDSWGQLIEPLAAQVPMMVGAGNHEEEQEVSCVLCFLFWLSRVPSLLSAPYISFALALSTWGHLAAPKLSVKQHHITVCLFFFFGRPTGRRPGYADPVPGFSASFSHAFG